MNTENIKKIIPLILIISLSINIYYYFSDSKIKNNAFCSQFKEQVSNRIKTYYTNGDVINIYPNEIFYSKKIDSCVAVWQDTEINPANNGMSTQYVIFDAITNEDIFSDTIFRFNDPKLNQDYNTNNATILVEFDKKVKELKK